MQSIASLKTLQLGTFIGFSGPPDKSENLDSLLPQMDAVAETKVAAWNANRSLNKLSALRSGLNLGDSALLADVTSRDLTRSRHAVSLDELTLPG